MTPYEELIEQMRKAGRFYNPQVPEFGIMGHDGRVKIGSGIINKSDYSVSSNLAVEDGINHLEVQLINVNS